MYTLTKTPGRTAEGAFGQMLFFSGYSYLGMQEHPAFMQSLREAQQRYGALYPSARITNTQLDLYTMAEAALSDWTGTAESVLFPNGFMAGKAVASLFSEKTIHYSPNCHPAILQQPNASDGDFASWSRKLMQQIDNQSIESTTVIFSDSVNPREAEVFDFSFLEKLPGKLVVVIDDSHGMGLLGPNGEGVMHRLPKSPNIEYIITYSMGKALHVPAGAVSCTNPDTATKLRHTAWYAATSPPSAAALWAFLQHRPAYLAQLERLRHNMKRFSHMAQGVPGLKLHHEISPVIMDGRYREEAFFQQGIIISSFAYPDPTGEQINRAVLNALHQEEDLKKLVDAMAAAAGK